MLKQKYGRDPEQMFAPVHQAAQISGIPLDLRKQPMIYNTVEAHALLQVAHERNLQVQLTDALFRAYFLEARNISQREVLTEVAAVEGLTSVEIESAWGRAPQVRREARDASKRGIRGVPFFVFQGELAVSGAQPVEALRSALRQASVV